MQSVDGTEINTDNELPVDDLSPISCKTLRHKLWSLGFLEEAQKQLKVEKMIMSYYFNILFYTYIVLASNYLFFYDYLIEADAKSAFPENALFYYIFDIRSSKLYCLIPVIIFFIILPAIFFMFTAYVSEKIEWEIATKIYYFMVGECGRFFFTSCERRERTSERSERVSSATPRNE